MRVIKRNGAEVEFDIVKIIAAVTWLTTLWTRRLA